MVVKEVKESIKIIEGIDEVVESENVTKFDKYGNVVYHGDDVGNSVNVEIEYYEQDGDNPPPVKSKTVSTTFLDNLTEVISTKYTVDGKKIEEKGTIYDTKNNKVRQEYTAIFNTEGLCNYESLKTVEDKSTNETFTITAKLPDEVKHSKNDDDLDNLWYFVDKNDLIVRSELYDNMGRLIKKEDYPNNKMYVYGFYNDTMSLSSYGILSIIDDKIFYIEENKFDSKDRVIYNETTSYEEAVQKQNWLKYDENGDCISHSEVTTDLSGEIPKPPKVVVTKCKYDENHHIIESSQKYEVHKYEYTYYE